MKEDKTVTQKGKDRNKQTNYYMNACWHDATALIMRLALSTLLDNKVTKTVSREPAVENNSAAGQSMVLREISSSFRFTQLSSALRVVGVGVGVGVGGRIASVCLYKYIIRT